MRQSIGTCAAIVVALLGLAGCGGADVGSASDAGTNSTASATSASNPAQATTSTTTSPSTSVLQAPLISGTPALTVGVGQSYMFRPTVSASNPAGVVFQISGKPAWASFNKTTGVLSGTPASTDIGVNVGVQISASSSSTTAAIPAFEITVTSTPTPASSATSSVTLTWTEPTTDTNGAPLTDLASYIVYYGTASKTYTNSIAVSNANDLSSVVGSLTVGQTYFFAVKAVTSSGEQSGFSGEVSATI
jgi:hypothetical protein